MSDAPAGPDALPAPDTSTAAVPEHEQPIDPSPLVPQPEIPDIPIAAEAPARNARLESRGESVEITGKDRS